MDKSCTDVVKRRLAKRLDDGSLVETGGVFCASCGRMMRSVPRRGFGHTAYLAPEGGVFDASGPLSGWRIYEGGATKYKRIPLWIDDPAPIIRRVRE
jgi:hypothetical protein